MTNLATVPLSRLGAPAPSPQVEPRRRWLRPAPDSMPRQRQRPRIVYAAVAIGGIAIIALAQLLLSIGLSDGAYQVSAQQATLKDLSRTNQALSEQLTAFSSPQNLVQNAQALGMVANGNTVYLRLSDGAVLGSPAPADAANAPITADQALVPNSLLQPEPVVAAAIPDASSAPPTAAPDPTVPWQGALPSPQTH
ncbi:hypothetical protein SAMN06295879_2695 [Agreia bicolorata]|uniref:Cell division protein FtsL n=1 Tax=Agreia bicolorata TaxID=110935 RepID=A0A1T4YD17_9MICO|nr:hypothetical protein [Agreia bicolorata]SKA99155.1 hypothetical protein SAMN06295879_2695 [Agreia bicolorata]